MFAASVLAKKRDGQALSDSEIRFLVEGFCSGQVTDYQMAAFAMAVCVRGMNRREIGTLTRLMAESGQRLSRPAGSERPRVDKHSTGGLGDKISLVLAPLLACCGADVPMISGRGLGLTGGTLDKLESIPGFQTQLSDERAAGVLSDVGAFIIGASERIAPADRKLYALRDVTGTVESVPLITSSILSKKLAANLDALVMDVKFGDAAFMKTVDDARLLADTLVDVGDEAGLPTRVIVSDMDQPLGFAVGNAIEVNEAVEVLRGSGPGCVRRLTLELGSELLVQVKLSEDRSQARGRLAEALDSGRALERFEAMVAAQGGQPRFPLPLPPRHDIVAGRDGYVSQFDCQAIGRAIVSMGGGRRRIEDPINPAIGLLVLPKIGDRVQRGQPLLALHADAETARPQLPRLNQAVRIVDQPVDSRPLIVHRG